MALQASARWWRQLALSAPRHQLQSHPWRACRCFFTPTRSSGLQSPPATSRARSAVARPSSSASRLLATSSSPPSAPSAPDTAPTPPDFCSGCGVRLQNKDPDRAGFFQLPKGWGLPASEKLPAGMELTEEEEEGVLGGDADSPAQEAGAPFKPDAESEWTTMKLDEFDLAVEDWLDDYEKKKKKGKGKKSKEVEEVKVDVSGWGKEGEDGEDGEGPPLFCARCYSLTHYGRVKSEAAEAKLPDFDIGKKVGAKINLRRFRRSVVLAVVDVADFDGSLPRAALKALLPRDTETGGLKTPRDVDLVIAVNKVDLLPAEATATRLDQWVRRRCKEAGIPRPRSVHLVSCTKNRGVSGLLKDLGDLVGSRGDVWVVGAQNSGKSSLINALRAARKRAEGAYGKIDPKQLLTIAALPGTTLGMIPVNGIMPTGCQMFDTPGVPHPFQLTSILTGAESSMLLAKRKFNPRTYRAGAGSTVMLGGVARIDILECPGATLYLTIWASDELSTHLGRTEGAGALWGKHAGSTLVPPNDPERVDAIGRLEPREVVVEGDSWTKSSGDIAVAGLGWVSVGVTGEAVFRVWAPVGIAVTTHQPLLKQFAKTFCKPGFSLAVGAGAAGGQKGKGGGKRKK